ncbi:MAG: hypothetical protein IAX22_06405 [Candidatus Bathyarchaeota archaeon]|nr:hypothetical protein [Candidatus Bathyarchaeota archaeon]
MKRIGAPLLISLILTISIFVGVTSALSASDAAVMGHISNASPKPGDAIFVTVTFQSYSDDPLRVLRVGFHGDWMGDQEFQGPNLMSNPVTVEAKGSYSTQFLIIVPSQVSVGSHNYIVGVDGSDQLGNTFSWDSSQYTLQVVTSSNTASPTPTTPSGDEQTDGDFLPYLVVIAAIVIVVLLIVLTLIRKKKKSPATKTETTSDQTFESKPEQPKTEDTTGPEQEFTI